MGAVKEELLAYIEDLMRECDERHMHADLLAEQVRELGGTPIPYEQVSPWDVYPRNDEDKLQ